MTKWKQPALLAISVLFNLAIISKEQKSLKEYTTLSHVTQLAIPGSNASDDDVSFDDSDDPSSNLSFDPRSNTGIPQDTVVNANNESKKILFVCGWRYQGLESSLFPEFVPNSLGKKTPSTSDSLLLLGIYGTCLSRKTYSRLSVKWIRKNWKGKVLVVNAENVAEKPIRMPETLFRIGMFPESDRSVYVLYMAIFLISFTSRIEWNQLFYHSLKPQSTRDHFCIYMVKHPVDFREVAVDEISSSIKPVDQWGECGGKNGTLLNNVVGTPRYNELHPASWMDNARVFRQYRFCMVMENSVARGYITEKMINAFLGGCIPIYYGTEEIFDIFNRNAFVFYDVSNPLPALERIRYLEENETAFLQVARDEPILAQGNLTVEKYFSLADGVGNGTLKRKIRALLGLDP